MLDLLLIKTASIDWSMLAELKKASLAKTSCSLELNNLVGMSML